MVLTRVRQATNCHVAIADSFNLEDSPTMGNLVKRVVDGFQECKHLSRLACAGPGSKPYDAVERVRGTGEQDSAVFACNAYFARLTQQT